MGNGAEEFEFLTGPGEEYFYIPARPGGEERRGLTAEVVDRISEHGREPDWLRAMRHDSLEKYVKLPFPWRWAPDMLGELNLDGLQYFTPLDSSGAGDWGEVAGPVRETFERLGVVEEEIAVRCHGGAVYFGAFDGNGFCYQAADARVAKLLQLSKRVAGRAAAWKKRISKPKPCQFDG